MVISGFRLKQIKYIPGEAVTKMTATLRRIDEDTDWRKWQHTSGERARIVIFDVGDNGSFAAGDSANSRQDLPYFRSKKIN
jgi:hypothetical protein